MSSITALNTIRPPNRSVSIPSGVLPKLPSKTGTATAILFSTDRKVHLPLRMGIMADIVPKTRNIRRKRQSPMPTACPAMIAASFKLPRCVRARHSNPSALSRTTESEVGSCDFCHRETSSAYFATRSGRSLTDRSGAPFRFCSNDSIKRSQSKSNCSTKDYGLAQRQQPGPLRTE